MKWTDIHGPILGQAFEKILGAAEPGTVAFVRCLTPDIVINLAMDFSFAPEGWEIRRVANSDDDKTRTVTADRAVEIREMKADATLFLVDTDLAGAGMDGIYSAAREVDEDSLFSEALRMAGAEMTRRRSGKDRRYAERAIAKSQTYSRRFGVSPWIRFDFLCRAAASGRHPGEHLHLLGLWPVKKAGEPRPEEEELNESRMFVSRLLETPVAGFTPARRIETLRLLKPSEQQSRDLERFLRRVAARPLLDALSELANRQHLWINALRVEESAQSIQKIELLPWRTGNDKITKWSGLVGGDSPERPPELILDPDAERTGNYARLEIRWKAHPQNLEKSAAEYNVEIATAMETLCSQQTAHSARREEKCRFSDDDFSLSEDAVIPAKVVVSVVGRNEIEPQESEEFIIRFGQPESREQGGVGKKIRTFSEGLIELDDRNMVSGIASSTDRLSSDSKGFLLLRTPQRGKSFRVFRPPLIRDVEEQWCGHLKGSPGRWLVRVRESGALADKPRFQNFSAPADDPEWNRVTTASRKMAERFFARSGIGQVYDEKSRAFETAKEYLRAWSALLDKGYPELALVNTVEVQTLSGRTIGLIVLPSHPLRVAWLAAYDNLVLHATFNERREPKEVREELSLLDGAMFPAFLPGTKTGTSFIFADMLGFHAVGMVPDGSKEPKAAVAMLARTLGGSEMADAAPTVGEQSAKILGGEILKYLECHDASRLLQVHALRAGDGLTMARALGFVHHKYRTAPDEEESDEIPSALQGFALEFYPSSEQRAVAGRFIAEAREKRRTGAGIVSSDDHWMLESLSLPGGISLPRLRWARKNSTAPDTAAHLAVAFDTFGSHVGTENSRTERASRPLSAFGLLSFFDKSYEGSPSPVWRSSVPLSSGGEKHPSERSHTERLMRLQEAVQKLVADNIETGKTFPVLRTEISGEKAQSLEKLHSRCDWVITLDRNAGIEYFDSPRDNRKIYDAYVIDCVPEREDLGCLQLITSTSNLDEIRNLLDSALDQMGLSRSRRNAEFLFENLKALSGRLAIRFTGQKAPTSELIALGLCHANCRRIPFEHGDCWMSLEEGFFIPADDILDLLPPVLAEGNDGDGSRRRSRSDIIYVSVEKKGLCFRFIEVKYRKHLRTARTPTLLKEILDQTGSLRKRWDRWYNHRNLCGTFRAVRRAKLARVLRFYADKAHRHCLPQERYETILAEIDTMIEHGGDYSFAKPDKSDRGWVFCPEYAGGTPSEISPTGWNTRVFLFGPGLMPDSNFHHDQIKPFPQNSSKKREQTAGIMWHDGKESKPREQTAETPDEKKTADPGISEPDSRESEPVPPLITLGTDTLTGTKVSWPVAIEGNPHLLIAGLPGMGKTTCLLNLCRQMLAANVRPIIFSYHLDLDEKLSKLVPSVRFIDFNGLGFNPLEVLDRSSPMAYLDVAATLRDIFMAIFPELGDIQGERIRGAIRDSFVEAGWDNRDVPEAGLNEPAFSRFVEILKADSKPDKGLRTLLARLGELDDYGFFDLRKSPESLWNSERPTVIRIHATQNDNLQKAFASLVFYRIYKDMFRRGIQNRITHAVIFDEAHRAAGMKLIPTMAKECRKFGISLVLASQEAKDFNSSVFSAVANYLVLRLTETDAKILIRNVASSQQERMLADKVKQMERFKALFFREGKRKPFPVNLLSFE